MCGEDIKFTCSHCEHEQTKNVGIIDILKINGDENIGYMSILCEECKTLNYVSHDGTKSILEKDVEDVEFRYTMFH